LRYAFNFGADWLTVRQVLRILSRDSLAGGKLVCPNAPCVCPAVPWHWEHDPVYDRRPCSSDCGVAVVGLVPTSAALNLESVLATMLPYAVLDLTANGRGGGRPSKRRAHRVGVFRRMFRTSRSGSGGLTVTVAQTRLSRGSPRAEGKNRRGRKG
jgi:hypothetical protein